MIPVFDAHSDIPSKVTEHYDSNETGAIDPSETVLENQFLPDMRENGIKGRIAAVYLQDLYVPQMATHRALNQIQHLKAEAAVIDDVEVVTSVSDLRTNAGNDVMSFLLGMEGAEPLQGDIDLLNTFYDLGVRVLGLTHSRRNLAGDGPFIFEQDVNIDEGGLSLFGIDAVHRMNDLGIAIDTVHINEPGFWNIIEHTSEPIINSHSIPREFRDTARNITDEQIMAIAETGGVVSLNALPIVYSSWPDRPALVDLLDIVDYTVDLIGTDNVGFGFDFFAYLTHRYDDLDESWSGIDNLDNDSQVSNLPNELQNHGYTESEVEDMLWRNNLRVLEDIID